MARRTFLLSEVNLTEESVNLSVSGNLTVTGTSTFTGVASFGDGTAAAPSITFTADGDTGFYRPTANRAAFTAGGVASVLMYGSGLQVVDSGILSWSSTSDAATGAADVLLVRDAAAVLALKNGTTAQKQRIYGSTATNSYMELTHNGTNALVTSSGGLVGFAAHTTSAATNVNGITGYLLVVDTGGTQRRLAVLT